MINCPHCQSTLDDAPELAGQLVACPHCGRQFPVPIPAPPIPETGIRIDSYRPQPAWPRPKKRHDKVPRMVLLVATIAWPVLSFLLGMTWYADSLHRWGSNTAVAAMFAGGTVVTGFYVVIVAICLAWWFYAKD